MKPVDGSITLNGQKVIIGLPCNVVRVLEKVGLKATQVVVERNGMVLSRERLTETFLEDGDRLEVIVPVAGG